MNAQTRWEKDNGDFTKILDYPLNENSQIIELGGFRGEWLEKVINKFDPKILIIEPVPHFYNFLLNKFGKNDKLIFDNSAISTENKEIDLFVRESSTSQFIQVSNLKITVNAYDIQYFITKYNLTNTIDLIQINIECEEYPLLMDWINQDFLDNVRFLQIQFHTFCEDYIEKYKIIEQGLINRGFDIKYRYDFVWESWENKKYL